MWLRGNGERWCAAPGELGADVHPIVPDAIAACREALGAATIDELGALPESRAAHGDAATATPRRSATCARSSPSRPRTRRSCSPASPSRDWSSATPTCPFRRISTTGGIELVNPGSVGLPFDRDPRAAYALVHDDRGVEHRRIPYDHGAAAARMRERWPGAAWAETVARRIEQARGDV